MEEYHHKNASKTFNQTLHNTSYQTLIISQWLGGKRILGLIFLLFTRIAAPPWDRPAMPFWPVQILPEL